MYLEAGGFIYKRPATHHAGQNLGHLHMPNILDDISSGNVDIADQLHTLICQTCEDIAGDNDAKRRDLHRALVACVADALLGECGKPLNYKPRFIASFVARPPKPSM